MQMLDRVQRDNEKFLYRQLLPAPPAFRPHIIKRYRDITKHAGHVAANLDLLDVGDLMTAPGVDIKRAGDDDAICIEAERLGRECKLMSEKKGELVAALYALEKGAGFKDGIIRKKYAARIKDQHFWRRALRKHYGRTTETAAIAINIVNRKADIYASNASIERRHQQKSRNRKLLESMQAINELGDEFTLQELAEKSVSNPVIRRCELMTRIAGVEQYAKSAGYVGEFYTITTPSRFHSALSKSGERNPKFDGSTPRDGQHYLCGVWSKVRAKLAREKLPFLGFRVCEPQHDGTPHWHCLFFTPADRKDELRQVMRDYALRDTPNEPGAQKHRFTAIKIDWSRGSAAGYIAKYIAKNIDGFGIDTDLFGNDPARAAQRVDAWASTWGIRQFQQIGGPGVTIWRELRRIKPADAAPDILDHVSAADTANFARFCELQISQPVALQMQPALNTETGEIRLNKYSEPGAPKVIGITLANVVHLTRRHVWTVGRKQPGISGPWSSVNNCTGVQSGREAKSENNAGTGNIEAGGYGGRCEAHAYHDREAENRSHGRPDRDNTCHDGKKFG